MLIRKSTGDYSNALTEREWEIMLGLAKGQAVGEIAKTLNRSVKTISTHRARILEKTGLKSNSELAVEAYKAGLIE